MVTLAGTVATEVLLEERFTNWPPAGAGPERVTVRFAEEPTETGRPCGVNVNEAVTWTASVAVAYPEAEAPMLAEPGARPVITGCVTGALDPSGMKTVVEESPATAELLLPRVTVTPPAGAFPDKLTWTGVDWPSPTVTAPGSTTVPKVTTFTVPAP